MGEGLRFTHAPKQFGARVLEATWRIELPHKSFADSRLTTCLRGRSEHYKNIPICRFLPELISK